MRRYGRNRKQRTPSSGRVFLFLGGGVLAVLILTGVLFSLRPPVSHQNEGSDSPPPSLLADPGTLTFYDTLTQTPKSDPGLLVPKPPKPEAIPSAPPRGGPPKPSPSTPGEGGFTIQVAAFRDRKAAEALVGHLKKGGYPAFLYFHPDPEDQPRLYRVRVGHYPNREEARIHSERLSREEKRTVFVTSEP